MPSAVRRKPVISIVIVSYNTQELTLRSIASVYESSGFSKKDLEVIVVDNNSTDGTVRAIKKQYPSVIVIANTSNKGFGTANNQGIKAASAPYILLLNSDAFLTRDAVKIMVQKLEESGASAVGPCLVYANGTAQPSAGYFPTPSRVTAWMLWLDRLPIVRNRAYHVQSPEWYRHEQKPEWLMGACILARRKDLEHVGGFDEKMFMYAEEVELCWRLNKPILYTPEATVVHLGGQSGGTKLLSELHGVEYIYRRHLSAVYWYIRIILKVGVILRIALYSLMPSRHDVVAEYKKYL